MQQQAAGEQYAYEQNEFALEDGQCADLLSSREQALLNTLHAAVRYGSSATAEIIARTPYQEALAAVHENTMRLFARQNSGTVLDSVQGSALGAGFWADIDIRSGVSRHTLASAETAFSRPQALIRAPSLSSNKRTRSDDSGLLQQQQQQRLQQPQPQQMQGEFVTARHQMRIDAVKRQGIGAAQQDRRTAQQLPASHAAGLRHNVTAFQNRAVRSDDDGDERISDPYFSGTTGSINGGGRLQRPRAGLRRGIPSLHTKKEATRSEEQARSEGEGEVDERLKNIDPRMIEMIESEILAPGQTVTWDDIAGLGAAKRAVHLAVIYPLLRPELFQGIRAPPRGLLLFGPPGTGKTLIARCIASQAGATFFNISASSLTSKWIGEGEKMVRALFAVARVRQPAVIFIDEIDSLLTQRTDGEQEATRRIKTEFLVQLDGCGTSTEDRIILLGATNRPQELDEAARRRFPKRLYVPLPDRCGRHAIVANLLRRLAHALDEQQFESICDRTQGFSGADMDTLCREAAFGPIRAISDIRSANVEDVRPICFADFEYALTQVRPSVSQKDLEIHIEFNKLYGMSAADQDA